MNTRSSVCRTLSALALLGCIVAPAALLHAQSPYKVLGEWKVGGGGRWDYLTEDPAAHRLYVTHGPRVEVLDSDTGKLVGAITDLKGTHGVALAPDGKLGYISDGGSNDVVVFDRSTLATVATVPTQENPDGIVYEPATKTVWAFNGHSRTVSVIDTATNKVVATISLPGKPEFPTADGDGHVYDVIENTSQLVKLDAHTHTITATWKVGCDSPSGSAIDTEHHHIFAVCDGNKMAVVDYTTGKTVATPSIGEGPDAARFSAPQQLAFSSNRGGTLSVVDVAHGFKTIETLPTTRGARTLAYDPLTDHVYLSAADYGPTPAATAAVPHPRPPALPGSFKIIVIGR